MTIDEKLEILEDVQLELQAAYANSDSIIGRKDLTNLMDRVTGMQFALEVETFDD